MFFQKLFIGPLFTTVPHPLRHAWTVETEKIRELMQLFGKKLGLQSESLLNDPRHV